MAHFAKVFENKVVQVIVAEPEFFETFVDNSPGEWLQTSYNTHGGVHYVDDISNTPSADQSKALRKNFAGVGYTYDRTRDAFIAPKPFSSWILDEDTCLWNPPVARPHDDKVYTWDEEQQTWIEVE